MDARRLFIGTVAGGITLFVVGQLIWAVTFASFFAANVGTATGVARDSSVYWALGVGHLSLALLLTLAITWARATSVAQGFKIAATVGFLVWLGVDFIHYGISNVSNLTATMVDSLLEAVHNGIAGAVIVAAIDKTGPTVPQGANGDRSLDSGFGSRRAGSAHPGSEA